MSGAVLPNPKPCTGHNTKFERDLSPPLSYLPNVSVGMGVGGQELILQK